MPLLRSRRLGEGVSWLTENYPPPPPPPPPGVDCDFVIIIASLLCVLVGLLGLVACARCSWIRRGDGSAAARSEANRGLKKKVLEALPKFTFGDEEDRRVKLTDCVICLTEFTAGDEVRVLPTCGHGFHIGCIDTWLGSHSSCPSCRQIPVSATCTKCWPAPPHTTTHRGGANTSSLA